jgi:hypothetical protein
VLFEEVEDVLGADDGPFHYQPVVLVTQGSAATDGDQSGVTLFREDRHDHIMAFLAEGVLMVGALQLGGCGRSSTRPRGPGHSST